MQYGIENEDFGRRALQKALSRRGINVSIRPCGLFLHQSGVLAASPDGVIDDETIVEIKCLSKYRNDREGALRCANYGIIGSGMDLKLSQQSIWYDQIQAQLHITNTNICFLICYIPNNSIIIRVPKDQNWGRNINKLVNYYWDVVFPKLLLKINKG